MSFRFRRLTPWLLLNLIGMGVYLQLASTLWTVSGDEGLPGGPGDAFYWFVVLAPILLVYLTINVLSLFAIAKRVRSTGSLATLIIWMSIAALWIVVVGYDHFRSLRAICPAAGC